MLCFCFQTFYRQCLQDYATDVSTTTVTPSNITQAPEISTSSNITEESSEDLQNASVTTAIPTIPTIRPGCMAPMSHVPDHVLPTLWHVVYWTSQVLTW